MPIDRSAWVTQAEAEERKAGIVPNQPVINPAFATHLKMVAAKLEHLESSDGWATFRAQIEALVAELEQEATTRRAQMDDLFGVEHDRARLALADIRGQIKGLKTALQAPGVVTGMGVKVEPFTS